MINNNVLEEYFIWEEKNLIDQNQNSSKNVEQDNSVTTTETKTNSMPNDWRDITDPKLRDKMRRKAYQEIYRKVNKDKRKAWCETNKLQLKDKRKAYYEANKDYYDVNKDKRKKRRKVYYELNKNKFKEYRRINKNKRSLYNKNYREKNIQYKISHNLRARLYKVINRNQKTGSAVSDLGCTVDELKIYLESKFQSGMTWNNYGKDGWHIDHIKPLSSFDLTDRKQFLEACHYTNLQPLWATDNLSKGDKII